MKIVFATKNAHKIKEISKILDRLGEDFTLLSSEEAGFVGDVEETGTTFEENSYIKASEVCKACNLPAIADDSGLEVDVLDGAPGVYSARFAGEGHDDAANNKKLLSLLDGYEAESRTARFVSVITLCMPDGRYLSVRGECNGVILKSEQGESGFGYDPLFFYPPLGKTFAQMSEDEKNSVSHRAMALSEFAEKLPAFLAK